MSFFAFRFCRPALGFALGLLAAVALGAEALPQRIYVWQRAWTPALQRGIVAHGPEFAALDVLVAEVAWTSEVPQVQRLSPRWKQLAETQRPVGVVVRVGRYAGEWRVDAPATRAVVDACRDALATSRAQGVEPAELQLDFDAATARLATYRELLATIRREVRPPRLVITTLPDWLRSADFPALVAATDAYVLQVHSLEKPRRLDDPYTLCDPDRAAAWIARAAELKHPFRVALPAYGYRVVFDPAGDFVGLEAEGTPQGWPASYPRRLALADPAALAHCVQLLLASPPAACEGIAWFRFPSADDDLAWAWPTLHAVMQGRTPVPHLVLRSARATNGAIDLTVANPGESSAAPVAFRVTWSGARLLAADALAGWQVERQGPDALLLRPPPHESKGQLRPGDVLHIAWLRLDRDVPVQTAPLTP